MLLPGESSNFVGFFQECFGYCWSPEFPHGFLKSTGQYLWSTFLLREDVLCNKIKWDKLWGKGYILLIYLFCDCIRIISNIIFKYDYTTLKHIRHCIENDILY